MLRHVLLFCSAVIPTGIFPHTDDVRSFASVFSPIGVSVFSDIASWVGVLNHLKNLHLSLSGSGHLKKDRPWFGPSFFTFHRLHGFPCLHNGFGMIISSPHSKYSHRSSLFEHVKKGRHNLLSRGL